MTGEFTLSIDLGNAAMRGPEHVAAALRDVAEDLHSAGGFGGSPGRIRDANGNTVGEWSVDADPELPTAA